MAQVAQQLLDGSSRVSESKAVLTCTLDDILERYLDLLHQYQSLQQNLCRDLSTGYISLAQANFSNPHRICYGQDFYDERMQATTRVSLCADSPPFSIVLRSNSSPSRFLDDKSRESMSLEMSETSNDRADMLKATNEASKAKCEPYPRDPLNWFGILVPPALRQSQAAFKSAATGIVPALASIAKEMKDVELEVRRARKKLRKVG